MDLRYSSISLTVMLHRLLPRPMMSPELGMTNEPLGTPENAAMNGCTCVS